MMVTFPRKKCKKMSILEAVCNFAAIQCIFQPYFPVVTEDSQRRSPKKGQTSQGSANFNFLLFMAEMQLGTLEQCDNSNLSRETSR